MKKSRNYPFLVGSFIAGLMILWGLLGPTLAPFDPMEVHRLRFNDVAYGGPPLRPLPPFVHPDHPLGLDRVSRDLLSRMLWAVRPTLILCLLAACVRVMVGLGFGIVVGIWGKQVQWLLDWMVIISGAIPMLLVAIAVVLFRPDQAGIGTFLGALTLTGWVSTAVLVQSRVHMILQATYIESARAIGLSHQRIVLRHVMPQIWPLIPVLLAAELSAVTILIAELGYLGLYVGGAFVYADFASDSPVPDYLIPTAGHPELGQMVSDFFSQVNRSPWEPLFAGSAIVLMLAGWTLLSEGLRRKLDITRPKQYTFAFWRKDKKAASHRDDKPAAHSN